MIDFNEQNRDREMPYFGQDFFLKSEQKGPLSEQEYLDALALNQRLSRAEGIDFVMDKFKLDALVAPDRRPRVDHRLDQWRPCSGRQFKRRGSCRLSQHQRDGRKSLGFAGWHLFFRACMERTHAVEDRVRVRATDEGAKTTALSERGRDCQLGSRVCKVGADEKFCRPRFG